MKKLALALVLVLAGCGGGGDDDTPTKAEAAAEAAAAEAEARRLAENEAAAKAREKAQREAAALASAQAALPPEPSDFTLGVIILKKECFGSAGCNVKFRIDPKYNGTADPNNLEVTYRVTGGEDEMINTFTIDDDGTASYPEEEMASTPSSNSELKAEVTSVRRAS